MGILELEPTDNTTPESGIHIDFLKVTYSWEKDREYVAHVFDGRNNLGPMDFEMSGDGTEVYIDGVSPNTESLFREIGHKAWELLADSIHGQIPLAERTYTPDGEFVFENSNNLPDLEKLAA